MALRKGFYFSFDAIMALTVMTASLLVVTQSTDLSSGSFRANTVNYQSTNIIGRDAMKLSSIETFRSYNDSYRDELKDNTVLTEEDMDRTILDGVTKLWAARNTTYAREAVQIYFNSKIPDAYEYRIQINESGTGSVLYETSGLPDNASTVSSVARLVSGHRIDRPSEGFQARARATEATTNITRVINIPMMGSGGDTGELRLDRKFNLDATAVHNATLYFSTQWGQSNFNSNSFEINDNEISGLGGSNSGDWLYYEDKGDSQIGFDQANVTDYVKPGWNNFTLAFNNQDDVEHARIQPGTRIVVTYSTEAGIPRGDYSYFTDVESKASNKNQRGGVWYTHPMYLPEGATVNNATLELELRNIRDYSDYNDVKVYMNDQLLLEDNVSGTVSREIDLEPALEEGNNVLSVYGNTIVEDGNVTGFTGYPDNPRIYSDPQNDPEGSTRVYFDYERPDGAIEYGEVQVSLEEEIGGSTGNPKTFDRFFNDVNITRIFINLAQMDNRNLTVQAGYNGFEKVFQSPREFATPSRIEVDPELVEEGEENNFRLEDQCTVYCYFLPESGLHIWASVPNQVGYGSLFPNRSAAVEDAEQRLRDRMGKYAKASNIETSQISTDSQPYIWGPASVKLVVWRE